MKLTYKELKEAIDLKEEKILASHDEYNRALLQAAKLYLPILLHQEFIKPNEHGNTDK